MSGYTNSLQNWGGSGQSLGFGSAMPSYNYGGMGPAPAQLSYQAPQSYSGAISGYNPTIGPSMGSGTSDTGIVSGIGGYGSTGTPTMDPAGISAGVASQPVNPANATQLGGQTSAWGGALEGFKTLASVVGTFGQIYSGIQMNKIAKQQLAFQKESYAENLKNQKKAYNNSSEARSRSAGVQNNWSDDEISAHIAKRAM